MNLYMKTQIQTMLINIASFETSLRLAAAKDDRQITKEEQKQIDEIMKLNDKYIQKLKKIAQK